MTKELTVELALKEAAVQRKAAFAAVIDGIDPMADPSLAEEFIELWETTEKVILNAVVNELSLQMETAIAELQKAPKKRTRKAPAKKVEPVQEELPLEEKKELTLKDLREAATAYMKSGDLSERKAEVISILKGMGVTNLMKLPEDKWVDFYAKVAA